MLIVYRKSDRMIMSVSCDTPSEAWYTSEPELYDIAEKAVVQVLGPSRLTEEGEIERILDFSPL